MTAAGEPVVAFSPAPFTPGGLSGSNQLVEIHGEQWEMVEPRPWPREAAEGRGGLMFGHGRP